MKTITDYENYSITKSGEVFNKSSKKIATQFTRTGYELVHLRKNNKRKASTIHRLVALAFIPNPENKPCVNHINGIKIDNRIENLEWVTLSENMKHAVKNGLLDNAIKLTRIRFGKIAGKYNKIHGTKIRSTSVNGEVKVFESLRDAQIGTGVERHSIQRNINKTFKGYYFEYDERAHL